MSIAGASRTLRIQLIGIVVLTVAVVLTLSQWIDTHWSEQALEQDMRERAQLVLRAVKSRRGHINKDELRAIIEGDREIVAINLFGLANGKLVLEGGPPGALSPNRKSRSCSRIIKWRTSFKPAMARSACASRSH
jgi:hypothetical protein